MSTWIKLYRDITKHWVFDDANYLKAWITILIETNHEKHGTVIKGTPVICERGQKAYSTTTWAKLFGNGWTRQKVRTFFKHLELDNMIIIEELKTITTKLTVCNYDTYQSSEPNINQRTTKGQPKANQKLTTIEELNNLELKNETIYSFDEFWNDYEKKIEVKKCKAKYSKIKESDRQLIKDNVKAYVKSQPDKQYRKNALTWLNGECWNDEIEKPQQRQSQKRQLKHMDGHMVQIFLTADEALKHKPQGAVNNNMLCIDAQFYFNPWSDNE